MFELYRNTISLTAVVLVAFWMPGCQESDNSLNTGDENIKLVSRVDSVQVIELTITKVTLRTVSTIPNPCHYLHAVEKNNNGLQTNVRILTTIDPDIFCIEILGSLSTDIALDRRGLSQLRVVFPGQIADFDTTLVF